MKPTITFLRERYVLVIIFLITCISHSQEINLLGNSNIITNGQTTTSITDFTNFGTVDVGNNSSNTFVIENNGISNLVISNPTLASGTHFSISTLPISTTITPGNSVSFIVTFAPNDSGQLGDVITINSDDATDSIFTFNVSGVSYLANLSSEWKYLDDGTDQGTAWYGLGFDDSTWASSNAEFGYGDGDENTVISFGPDANNKYITTYFRKTITANAVDVANSFLIMEAIRDDGMVVYINGVEVWKDNMPAVVDYTTTSIIAVPDESILQTLTIPNILNIGTNEIAVEMHQVDQFSTDLSFGFQIYTSSSSVSTTDIDIYGNGVIIDDGEDVTSLTNHTHFGNVAIASSITRTFTIENDGVDDLFLSLPITLNDNVEFVITAQPTISVLSAGSTATLEVTFTPTIQGSFFDQITVLSNDATEGIYTFNISGNSHLLNSGGSWEYLDDGTDQGTAWYGLGFDDSSWASSNAEFGYGDGDETTVVSFGPDINNKHITTYFRKTFITTAADVANVTLNMEAIRDDGMIVYINGVEVWRNNMQAVAVDYTTEALISIGNIHETTWITQTIPNILNVGTNEIAVEIHQIDQFSSDLSFDFALYTNNDFVVIRPPILDNDLDLISDINDSDDDNDGITDLNEGCFTANLEGLSTAGDILIEESILGSFPIVNHPMGGGNTVSFSISDPADFSTGDITSFYAGDHGWSIRVDGPNIVGTLTMDFTTPVNGLSFKLADIEESESWTVNAYDNTNTLIDLSTSGNATFIGSSISQIGNRFFDMFNGEGINGEGENIIHDVIGSAYFSFPGVSISRIEFLIDQPIESSVRIALIGFCGQDTDGDTIDDHLDSDSDNDGIPDIVEAGGVDTDGDGILDDAIDTDRDGLGDTYDSNILNFSTGEISNIIDGDFDNDGIPNRLDLDSDNDGITDLREARLLDVDNTGKIDGFIDVNNDGYHDVFDGLGSALITGADTDSDGIPNSYPNKNRDGIGLPNFLDIDSDDDGITDNTEAQSSLGYIGLANTDVDSGGINDGLDDNYDNDTVNFGGGGLIPIDTDFDLIPDYLDVDSDDGEELDIIEGHDTNGDGVINGSDTPSAATGLFTSIDADNDGLDDGFDNNISTYDATNSNLNAISHPIVDAGTDRDWRHTQSSLDFDGLNDFVDFGDNYNAAANFSLEAWILQEITVISGTIISKRDAKSGEEKGYHLAINNGFPNLSWYNTAGVQLLNITSPYAVTNNTWTHISATFDGVDAKLYIDGLEVASDTPSSGPSNISEKFIIGAMYDSDTPLDPKNHFNGFIDEVRIWNVSLEETQLREMMNQEIEQNGTAVRGKIIPIDISGGLLWANLDGYYPMTVNTAIDASVNTVNGFPRNITTTQLQTAPLPYTSIRNGEWSNTTAATPWLYGDTVWSSPNAIGADGTTPIDWNIVQMSHDITSGAKNITVLGLVSDTAGEILTITNPLDTQDETNSGQYLRVSKYLELDGDIDLIGESQLLQDEGSILDADSGGSLKRDQQGTASSFNYNYWSSSVSAITPSGLGSKGTGVASNNSDYSISSVMLDGTTSNAPELINYVTSPFGSDGTITSPITSSSYWLFKFNGLDGDYLSWEEINETSSLLAGEGFTRKGTSGTLAITDNQNYSFLGKPNNGDIVLPIAAGDNRLIGNPYPSAIDADAFIRDNIRDNGGNAGSNIINGVIYYWDHFSGATHIFAQYVGGYGTYTLMGGVPAIANDVSMNATGEISTKTPTRYVPLNQGFFVDATLKPSITGSTVSVTGGDITFKNRQRIFITEASGSSIHLKTNDSDNTEEYVDNRQKIRLNFDSPSGYHRQILVGVEENVTNGFDIGYDAPILDINQEDMYWSFNNANFVIQAVNNFDENQVLPITIKVDIDGVSNINIEALENIPNERAIFVHDTQNNSYHNLRISDFEIYLTSGLYENRFEIVFEEQNSLGINEEVISNLEVYYVNDVDSILILNPDLQVIKKLELFNVLGQSIYINSIIENNSNIYLKRSALSSGAYILKLQTTTGEISKKILVE